jgi:enamine deaminase RidA (YjgF/YER057c/UK114 family)
LSPEPPDRLTRLRGDPASPWEETYGFCRVVKADRVVLLGGTTSVDPTGMVLGATPYEQTLEILRKIEHELTRVGAAPRHIVRTRVYVTDISRCEEVGRAHADFFADAPPVTTMVEVSGLIDPRMLVEIEAEALLD